MQVLSFISPRIVELFKLKQNNFEKSWLVQLATCTKRKVTIFVKNCEFDMNGFKMQANLDIPPLGYYDL